LTIAYRCTSELGKSITFGMNTVFNNSKVLFNYIKLEFSG